MNYREINDYEQLYLIKENDDDSFNLVFQKYRPIIISLAKRYYKKVNYHYCELDDLIQEGYIGLNNAIKSFKEYDNNLFYTFCIICIKRQMQNYCRGCFAYKNLAFMDSVSLDDSFDDGAVLMDCVKDDSKLYNPIAHLDSNTIYKELIKFKNSLSMNQSLVFELRYNGFKYKEISTLLGITISSVDNCIHYIKTKFVQYFTDF